MSRTLITLHRAAALASCNYGTVRNRVKEGVLPVYKLPGRRGHFVDKTEAMAVLTRRQSYATFGPDAVVRDLSKVVGAEFEVEE